MKKYLLLLLLCIYPNCKSIAAPGHKYRQCDNFREIPWFGDLDCKKVPIHKDALTYLRDENSITFKAGEDIPLVSGSWKNEFRDNNMPHLGSVYTYHLETKIFKDSVPNREQSIVIAQWHDRKVGYKKLSRKNKDRADRSRPPLSVRIIDHQLFIILWNDRIFDQKNGTGNGLILHQQHINFGKWHTFDMEVKWSANSSGYLNFYINGVEVVQYKGAIGYKLDRVGPYFKFGVYTVHSFEDFGQIAITHRNYQRQELLPVQNPQ